MNDCAVVMWLLSVALLLLRCVPSSARTLTSEDDRCGGPYNPSPKESLMVTHTEPYLSGICRDMSFSGWDYDNSVEREVCVRVTDYKMDCSQKLEYREGGNRGNPSKSYDCNDKASTIPILCTYELLYIRIDGDEPSDYTRVLYTVYSGQEKPSEEGSFSIFAILGPLIILAVCVCVCIFVFYIRRKTATQLPNRGGAALYNPGQQPQVNVHHYYHTVQNQDVPPNQNPGQGQPYPPQGYSMPSQISTQFPNYATPNAPVAYPLAPGQQIIPPQSATSVQSSSGGPPSYDEVTKQKL